MYKAFPYEKTSVRTKLYKCFYVFISYRERISFISDAAPRRLTSKCACGRVLFKSQLLTLGYFCFGYRPVGSYIFFGNRSHLWSEKPSEMAVFLRLSPDFIVICQPWRCNMGIASVSKYVASLNEEQQRHICAFIEFMNAEFPQLSNKISFSMPMWLVGKR